MLQFRYCFRESTEKIENIILGPMLSVSGYRGIEVKEYDDENRKRRDEDLVGYRVVRPGQLVVNTMWLNYAGLGVSNHEGHVSPAYRSYYIDNKLHKQFAHHLMRSEVYVKGYTKFLTGIRPNSLQLSREDLMTFPVLVPPADEQSAIAAFLDHETRKIDALVAEQEQLIALLREKRQAVISHAVTKGLNPDAPMRPSGIEWLGEVPAHWRVTRLKFVANVQLGIAKGKDYKGHATTSVPYLRVANVQDGYLNLDDVATIEIAETELPRFLLQTGDVLMNEGGDFDKLGRGCVWHGEVQGCIHQNHVFAVRSRAVKPEWLSAVTGSNYAQFYFMMMSKQSTNLASISSTNLMELPVVLPPVEETDAILRFIDSDAAQLDALMSAARRAVSLLQERRSALISAAVTGQIDVRQVVPAVKAA